VEQVCTTGNFVVALADGVVSFVLANDITVAAPVVLGKDARCICAHTGVEDQEQLPEVCVSYRKKLVLYAHGGRSFEARQEFPTPDAASALVWHQSWIVAGYKKEYTLYSDSSGLPREICGLDGKVNPRIAIVSGSELLLMIQESAGFFYNLSTQQPSSKGTVTWPRKVVACATAGHYILGSTGVGQVDVFGVRDQKNWQTLTMQGAVVSICSAFGGRAIVASEGSLTCLDPVPFERQIKKLLLQARIADALDLLNSTFGPEDPSRESQLSRLHALAGWGLFRDLQFSKAFQHFMYSSDVKVARVLVFWRRYLPLAWDPAAVGGKPTVDDGAPEQCEIEEFIRAQLMEKQGSAEQPSASASAVSANVGMANAALVSFLLRQREALLSQEHGQASKDPGQLLPAVDTALLKLLIETDEDDTRLQRLLEGGVRCVIEDLESFLRERQRPDVLARLCKVHGRHEMVLQEWSAMLRDGGGVATSTGGQKAPRFPTAQIVAEMVAALCAAARAPGGAELLRSYVPLLLKVNPAAVLPVFTTGTPGRPSGPLASSEVLELLKDHGELVRGFLEHLVASKEGAEPRHFVQLALGYLTQVADEQKVSGEAVSAASSSRRKLLNFLEESSSLDIAMLLPRVEDMGLLQEKVVLCSRSVQHREALRVLVEDLNDLPRAEIYCRLVEEKLKRASRPQDRRERPQAEPSIFSDEPPQWARGIVFGLRKKADAAPASQPSSAPSAAPKRAAVGASGSPGDEQGGETRPMMLFLQVLLGTFLGAEQRPGEYPKVAAEYKEAALSLLMGYAGHSDLPTHEVVGVLPASWPLECLAGYFSKCARLCLHERRSSMFEESLSSMAYLKTFGAWATERMRKVTMDKEKCCPTCNRRFVGQDNVAKAFVAYPNETCVHLQCKEDLSVCPKTGQNFADNLSMYCSALCADAGDR